MKSLYFLFLIPFLLLAPHMLVYAQTPEVTISIPQEGTSEFCGKFHTCFIPMEVLTQVGTKATWINDDLTSVHTVTSGDVVVGHDGIFGSRILGPLDIFSYTFEDVGIFPYYCTIHPWKEGMIKITSDLSSQRSDSQFTEMEKLERENALLKRQIQELQNEVAKLKQVVMEQMSVIFEWVSSR